MFPSQQQQRHVVSTYKKRPPLSSNSSALNSNSGAIVKSALDLEKAEHSAKTNQAKTKPETYGIIDSDSSADGTNIEHASYLQKSKTKVDRMKTSKQTAEVSKESKTRKIALMTARSTSKSGKALDALKSARSSKMNNSKRTAAPNLREYEKTFIDKLESKATPEVIDLVDSEEENARPEVSLWRVDKEQSVSSKKDIVPEVTGNRHRVAGLIRVREKVESHNVSTKSTSTITTIFENRKIAMANAKSILSNEYTLANRLADELEKLQLEKTRNIKEILPPSINDAAFLKVRDDNLSDSREMNNLVPTFDIPRIDHVSKLEHVQGDSKQVENSVDFSNKQIPHVLALDKTSFDSKLHITSQTEEVNFESIAAIVDRQASVSSETPPTSVEANNFKQNKPAQAVLSSTIAFIQNVGNIEKLCDEQQIVENSEVLNGQKEPALMKIIRKKSKSDLQKESTELKNNFELENQNIVEKSILSEISPAFSNDVLDTQYTASIAENEVKSANLTEDYDSLLNDYLSTGAEATKSQDESETHLKLLLNNSITTAELDGGDLKIEKIPVNQAPAAQINETLPIQSESICIFERTVKLKIDTNLEVDINSLTNEKMSNTILLHQMLSTISEVVPEMETITTGNSRLCENEDMIRLMPKISQKINQKNRHSFGGSKALNMMPEIQNEKASTLNDLLAACSQTKPSKFDNLVKKLGEATFSEVYSFTTKENPQRFLAVKVMPFGAAQDELHVNGSPQISIHEVTQEVLITRTLSEFERSKDFNEDKQVNCPIGSNFVELHQLFAIIILANGGTDLEHFKIRPIPTTGVTPLTPLVASKIRKAAASTNTVSKTWSMVRSILMQVILSIESAERELKFEHRDLHWGNILCAVDSVYVGATKRYFVKSKGDGGSHWIDVDLEGVKVTIIDYTLSRCEYVDTLPVAQTFKVQITSERRSSYKNQEESIVHRNDAGFAAHRLSNHGVESRVDFGVSIISGSPPTVSAVSTGSSAKTGIKLKFGIRQTLKTDIASKLKFILNPRPVAVDNRPHLADSTRKSKAPAVKSTHSVSASDVNEVEVAGLKDQQYLASFFPKCSNNYVAVTHKWDVYDIIQGTVSDKQTVVKSAQVELMGEVYFYADLVIWVTTARDDQTLTLLEDADVDNILLWPR
ncbi:Serine/threonine-protein kinase haspin [Physocladia obscura]|uniref:Serine/threonine-protein kinase haspin n=1 Tax=Physocladia obscura TaxID=109957 RepID=A0AAD5T140_9FUNG|nr:Serine/threonine-protein kinase haspin [Physocladia obscura]